MKLTIGVVVVIIVVVSILVFIFTASYYKSKAKVSTHDSQQTKTIPPWEKFTNNQAVETEKKPDATTAILKTGIDAIGNKKGFFNTFKDVLNVTSKKIEEVTRNEDEIEEERDTKKKDIKVKTTKKQTKTQRIWKRQERCREILEKIFNKKFPQSRPAWNINTVGCPELGIKPGRRLELDGYCKEEGIAFEHQGKFHDVEGEAFSADPVKFRYIQTKDQVKRDNCENNNVILLSIPDEDVIPYNDLYEYITEDLERRGLIDFDEESNN